MGMKAEEVLAIAIAKIKSGGGTGGGDMNKSDYDPNSVVREAGGIEEFVNGIGTNKANESTISRVENGNTASAKIDKDEQFYHNNVLYTATSDIAQGGNIVTSGTGQNCEVAQSVTSQIAQKADKSDLGTASAKNSTSVVTDSTDLVESRAVYDALGFGNKNLCIYNEIVNNVVIASCKNGVTYTFSYTSNGHNGFILRKENNSGEAVAGINVSEQGVNSVTFTADADFNLFLNGFGRDGYTFLNSASDLQLEVGSTATAYEPYHASVEESLDEKADNTVIAPVENGSTASQAYAVGEHFIRDGAFCTCKQAISQGGSFTLDTNYTAGDVAELLSYTISEPSNVNTKIALDSTRKTVVKCGNVVSLKVRFEVLESLGTDTVTLFNIPVPIIVNYLMNFYNTSSPYEMASFTGYITGGGNLVIKLSSDVSSGKFDVCGTYLCK